MDPQRGAQRRLTRIDRLFAAGSIGEALRRCRLEVQRDPGRTETLALLAKLLVANGRAGEAVELLEGTIAKQPTLGTQPVDLLHYLGLACQAASRWDQSEQHYRRVLAIDPEHHAALISLGQLLEVQAREDDAIAFYRENRAGRSATEMGLGLARTLMSGGKLAEARDVYQGLLEKSPGLPAALTGQARLLEIEGKSQEAHDLLEPLVEQGDPDTLMVFARLLIQLGRHEQARDLLRATLAHPGLNPEYASRLHRHLAQSLDRLEDYEGAMTELRIAHRGRGRFEKRDCVSQTQCLIDFFGSTRDLIAGEKVTKAPTPVFIVGMPRSGTSLVEQILAAHSAVRAGGERADLLSLADGWGGIGNGRQQFPARLRDVGPQWFASFAERYRAGIEVGDATQCITDKMPPNHLFLGLIELLLPDARIVDCRRDPMDTGLSCYFQEFSGHWFDFNHDPASIGVYYHEYRRLMAHWQGSLKLPVLSVQYEELVSDIKPQTERLLEFVGLPWEDACLRFFDSDRPVRTASHAQVRKPVYQSSVGRARHYLEWLKPMSDAMSGSQDEN